MVLQVTVTEQDGRFVVTRLAYTPTFVDPQSMKVLPVVQTLRGPNLEPSLRQALLDSWQRTVTRVDMLGADRVGVQPSDSP
jgi:hypothetical protein